MVEQCISSDGEEEQTNGSSVLSQMAEGNIRAVARLEKKATTERTQADFLADAITRFVGSMTFVYLHLIWFVVWIVFNSLPMGTGKWRIDPYPFTFLTFIVSLEAIFLSTFILISQNHEERLAQRRNHLDLQINLLSEQETSKIIQMLESIQERLGLDRDPEAQELEKRISPEEIVGKIDQALERDGLPNTMASNT